MKKRKMKRGRPLSEAVTKGSLSYTVAQVRSAFYSQHPDRENDWLYVAEVFDDHLIISSDLLAPSEYYYVTYVVNGSLPIFADRTDWEIVELTYQPQTIVERLKEQGGQRVNESIQSTAVRLSEAVEGQPRIIHMDVAQADVINGNGRRYRQAVLREAVAEARHHLQESLSQGRAILLGESEHPNSNGKRQGARLNETIVKWTDIWFDKDGWVRATGEMIENIAGRDAIVTMDAGVLPGGSLRGFGEHTYVQENGRQIQDVDWLRFVGIDLVMIPSFADAGVTQMESLNELGEKNMSKENDGKTPLTAAQLRVKYPELVEEITRGVRDESELQEAREAKQDADAKARATQAAAERDAQLRADLGLEEGADLETAVAERGERLRLLEEKETQREMATFIDGQIDKLENYPVSFKNQLAEAVALLNPTNLEEAKVAFAKQRGIFDKVVAGLRLTAKGFGSDIMGAVLEGEGSAEPHVRASNFITESLNTRNAVARDPKRPLTVQEKHMQVMLTAYDKKYKSKLLAESREYAEAEETSDLNLPYSVSRAVIEQAYPMLISTAVFDYGMATQSPDRVYFEEYAGETGSTATITDESFTSDHDEWVSLDQKRIDYAGVVVTSDPAGTTYTYGTDYVLDYAEGAIKVLSGGTMADATGFLIDYTYQAIRKGEMAAIERGKLQLTFKTLEMHADRLAQQISHEAVVFSRSQMGWDATSRTLNALVKEVITKIDGDRLRLALNSVLAVASNSGGTWTSATDPLSELNEKIGAAKVKVANRHYDPTFILMSVTNSDVLSNWDGFTEAGKTPANDLNANGYVGRIKGLPVFASSQFPDSHILCGNKELVAIRVYQPMQIKGPYPSYDSNGKLIAAEQYYVEEYNGAMSPIPEKGSYVIIA